MVEQKHHSSSPRFYRVPFWHDDSIQLDAAGLLKLVGFTFSDRGLQLLPTVCRLQSAVKRQQVTSLQKATIDSFLKVYMCEVFLFVKNFSR